MPDKIDSNSEKNVTPEEISKSVARLKEAADKVREENYEARIGVKDVVMDILGFIIYVVLGFGWMFLMLSAISFVGLGFFHISLKTIITASIVSAVVMAVYYIVKLVKK